jgi:hypothetical protein
MNVNSLKQYTVPFLFAVILLSLCVPIEGLDFFWHLGTGRWILDHLQIPDVDPFSFPLVTPDVRDTLILKGYWLAQVIYASVWSLMGAYGIVLLKASTLAGVLFVVYSILKERGFSPWVALLFLLPIFFDFRLLFISATRPQLWTFLCSAVIVYLLDNQKLLVVKYRYVLLFILMVVWVNLHPGALFGFLLLLVYAVARFIKALRGKGDFRDVLGLLVAASAILISPTGWLIFTPLMIIGSSAAADFYYAAHPDGMTLYGLWQMGLFGFYGFVVVLLTSVAIVIIYRRVIKLEHFFVFVLLTALAIFKARYSVFMSIVGTAVFVPYAKDRINSFIEQNGFAGKGLPYLSSAMICCSALVLFFLQGSFLQNVVNEEVYPRGAIEFMRKYEPQGNLLNPYEWGGYLIANLPEYKVFIDGRGMQLSKNKIQDFEIMRTGFSLRPGDESIWNSKMRSYGIRAVLAHRAVEKFPVNNKLYMDPDWMLVYQDEISYVFFRKPYQ